MTRARILITGVSGFLGSALCRRLLNQEFYVTGFDKNPKVLNDNSSNKNYNFIQDDIKNISKYKDMILENDIIFHLAANPSVNYANKFPVEDFKINTLGSLEILDIIKGSKIRFVYASTIAIYSDKFGSKLKESEANPQSFYGFSKLTSENYINQFSRSYGLNYIILRFGYIYGTGCNRGPIFDIINPITNDSKIMLFQNPESKLDFLYVEDAVDALIMAGLEDEVKAEILNISEGKGVRISEIMKDAQSIFKKKNILYEISSNADMQKKELVLDNTKSKKILKWSAKTSLKEGIIKMLGR